MSKPTTTDENDKQPDSTARLFGKWTLPDNCVIVERTGEKFALVGPPMRRIELPQGGGVNSDDPT